MVETWDNLFNPQDQNLKSSGVWAIFDAFENVFTMWSYDSVNCCELLYLTHRNKPWEQHHTYSYHSATAMSPITDSIDNC